MYNESNITGSSHQRAGTITIRNPLDSDPSIAFMEEIAIALDTGDHIIKPVGVLQEVFHATTATTQFPVLGTDRTSSYQEVYELIYSLYMFLANKRDTGV